MILDRKTLMLIAALGSALLLGGAFVFQFLGYPPCAMCLWQRWPHAAAIVIGLMAFALPTQTHRALALLGALAAAITGGLGVYHTGVERGWWQGPTSCTSSGGLNGLTGGDLLSTVGPKLVLCDQVSWQLFGLSMASWNALASFVLVAIWIWAARRPA
ncbi:disulfide bond formation protein B [Thalassovita taeanensis]|uniref:Disulfide bond formation protein DsbB n=1 Tax=Thalassovita taeanensis TaxID=657014 RepID=A0A1H8YWK9_9RHOB|nr:disulfide bond formation protein B [Thalassovita taeanensis]SEP56615.1 Disulfide bond formation protein DsbB [Thalassovita taeanensis]